jgi:hypothetical protein
MTRLGGILPSVLLLAGLGAGCSAPPTASASQPEQANQPTRAPLPVTACGGKELPDCPLQGWMKSTVQAYLNAGDTTRLARALDELERHPPDGFAGWSASARAAAEAARAGDVPGVRTQCQACHEQHRANFRAQMRTVRLF